MSKPANGTPTRTPVQPFPPTMNAKEAARRFVNNELMDRLAWMKSAIDKKSTKDVDKECDYPAVIDAEMYRRMHDREGIASKVNTIHARDTWKRNPEIKETEDSKESAWEKNFQKFVRRFKLWNVLQRLDEVSGIGEYGGLLFGIQDNKPLDQPVDGFPEDPDVERPKKAATRKLLYLRVLDQTQLEVAEIEGDENSPRCGQPKFYNVKIAEIKSVGGRLVAKSRDQKVHWHRILHIADNKLTSEVYGVPRQQNVYNYLLNLRKILGGSPEMLWKGGFPGLNFKIDPTIAAIAGSEFTVEKQAEFKDEVKRYANGLTRYLSNVGIDAQVLSPNVADPTSHFEIQLRAIAATKDVPWRIFLGSEAAQLASEQDLDRWNDSIRRRQETYAGPEIVRGTIDRSMDLGVLDSLPDYVSDWDDIDAPSDLDIAEISKLLSEALAKYAASGCEGFMPFPEYLTHVWKWEPKVVEAVAKAGEKRAAELQEEEAARMEAETAAAIAIKTPPDANPDDVLPTRRRPV